MQTLHLVGIGPGGVRQLTLAATDAIAEADVFFVLTKADRDNAEPLADIRRMLIAEYSKPGARVVSVIDPPRDRSPATDSQYRDRVRQWHDARAAALGAALDAELPAAGTAALLLWGDPALYDSAIRIIDTVLAQRAAAGRPNSLRYTVTPGISSVAALTAAHRIPLNRVGEAVVITTGRVLARGAATPPSTQVVMLDAECTFITAAGPDDEIYWGAYLTTPDEILISGTVAAVGQQIVDARAAARATHGWVFDIYLLRAA